MVFGITLFTLGFLGTIAIIISLVLSPLNPWNYKGIVGWYGTLLGMKMELPIIMCLLIAVFGFILCWKEAIKESKE